MVMPRWDGTTLIRRVRADYPAQRILIITGRPDADVDAEPLRHIPVLRKPFAPSDLIRAVRYAMRPRSGSAPVGP
jgi:DNA-binding response OmpR family regulator